MSRSPSEVARLRAFDSEMFVYLAIAASITILRTYARVHYSGWKGLGPDDGLAWVGLVRAINTSRL